jgi:hypothetical protein
VKDDDLIQPYTLGSVISKDGTTISFRLFWCCHQQNHMLFYVLQSDLALPVGDNTNKGQRKKGQNPLKETSAET